jgi:hypothetical protein
LGPLMGNLDGACVFRQTVHAAVSGHGGAHIICVTYTDCEAVAVCMHLVTGLLLLVSYPHVRVQCSKPTIQGSAGRGTAAAAVA